ncbi:hypothetical protein LCGC14_3026060, partial [marine sediment metagenome]
KNFTQWTSSQNDFRNAIDDFLIHCDDDVLQLAQSEIPYCNFMVGFPGFGTPLKKVGWRTVDFWLGGWGGYVEIYADLLSCAGGVVERLPTPLRPFFDQGVVDEIASGLELEYTEMTRCQIRR